MDKQYTVGDKGIVYVGELKFVANENKYLVVDVQTAESGGCTLVFHLGTAELIQPDAVFKGEETWRVAVTYSLCRDTDIASVRGLVVAMHETDRSFYSMLPSLEFSKATEAAVLHSAAVAIRAVVKQSLASPRVSWLTRQHAQEIRKLMAHVANFGVM